MRFWMDLEALGAILDRFLIDFRSQNQSKINQKSIKRSSQQHNNQKAKMLKNYCVLQYNRALGHVMLSTKTDKNRLNILLKTASKSMLQLGSILEPTWLHFGRVLGVKMWPSWLQLALKTDPKNDTKNDHLWYRLKIDF